MLVSPDAANFFVKGSGLVRGVSDSSSIGFWLHDRWQFSLPVTGPNASTVTFSCILLSNT